MVIEQVHEDHAERLNARGLGGMRYSESVLGELFVHRPPNQESHHLQPLGVHRGLIRP